jgi:hypothetical protein
MAKDFKSSGSMLGDQFGWVQIDIVEIDRGVAAVVTFRQKNCGGNVLAQSILTKELATTFRGVADKMDAALAQLERSNSPTFPDPSHDR